MAGFPPSIAPAAPPRPGAADPVRVMVCDDSAVIRGLLTKTLEGDADIQVITTVANGRLAVEALRRTKVDVIVLDIEMPEMDGLTAIPLLLAAHPPVKIIMASTLTLKNADISMRAMRAGAADYLSKPTSTRELQGADVFKRDLIGKVKALGAAARRNGSAAGVVSAPGRLNPTTRIIPVRRPVVLRKPGMVRSEILAIGSSTGGPQALFDVISHFKPGLSVPLLITQHMPPTFTTILAEHIGRQCGIDCVEARNGELILAGRAYLAPGDFHMTVTTSTAGPVIVLNKDPPENFCRPAVDPMLRSLVKVYGAKVTVIILTGMGSDGMKGAEAVVTAGGTIIAQDEASSVVWGMPGAVATAGLCSSVLPVSEIGPFIRKLFLRSAA